ncbi:hypothetical protein P9112_001548 [Eukaryota sp. TZLM1-RC]
MARHPISSTYKGPFRHLYSSKCFIRFGGALYHSLTKPSSLNFSWVCHYLLACLFKFVHWIISSSSSGTFTQLHLFFDSLFYFLLTISFAFLFLSLLFYLFNLISLPVLGFHVTLYIVNTLLILAPFIDTLLQSIAGLTLSPSTIAMYLSHDGVPEGQNDDVSDPSLIEKVIDVMKMGFDLDFASCFLLTIFLIIWVFCVVLLTIYLKKLPKFKSKSFKLFLISGTVSLIIIFASFVISTTSLVKVPPELVMFSYGEGFDNAKRKNLPELPNYISNQSMNSTNFMEDELKLDPNYQLIRDYYPLPKDRYWISNQYPLIHGSLNKLCKNYPKDVRCQNFKLDPYFEIERPDIFLLLWESVSGNFLSTSSNPFFDDCTPNLDKLWKQHGVVYDQVVSSSCPTANSWWSIFNQILPIPTESSIKTTLNTKFQSFPNLISKSNANYTRIYMSGASPAFDGKHRWLEQKENSDQNFYKYENSPVWSGSGYTKKFNNDRILVDQMKKTVDQYDEESVNKPLFLWSLSISTHLPFSTFDDPKKVGSQRPKDWVEAYKRSLRYSDEYFIGRFIDYLKTRNRANNTIVVIQPDHAAYTLILKMKKFGGSKSLFTCLNCPEDPISTHDELYHTTSIILFLGGEEQRKKLKIPPPGTRDSRVASVFDVISTIVEFSGAGDEPTHSLGRSLVNPNMDDSLRKTLSMASNGAELGLSDSIVRTDWTGAKAVTMPRKRPTYMNNKDMVANTDKFKEISGIQKGIEQLIRQNMVWNDQIQGQVNEIPEENATDFNNTKQLNFNTENSFGRMILLLLFTISIGISLLSVLFSFLCNNLGSIVAQSSYKFDDFYDKMMVEIV